MPLISFCQLLVRGSGCRVSVYLALAVSALALLLATSGSLSAQTPISGVVNLYTPVTYVGSCVVDVVSTSGISAGDRVLIIQMTGATIQRGNNADFGSILSHGSVGNYELGTVASISGRRITLTRKLSRDYDVRGRVQLLRVPRYENATVVDTLTCPDWNGMTGGILAVEATGTITLRAPIVTTGRGFTGGALFNVEGSCTRTDYFYDSRSSYGANKGEGIVHLDSAYARGRGRVANAGGGGNDHNAGGGGGANVGAGGMGGYEFTQCTQGEPATRGIGGMALPYDNTINRIYMGGGGGAGHTNNRRGSAGAAGGGIILLRAGRIEGNGHAIASDGATASNTINGGYDGAGGAGAGGVVLLDVPDLIGALPISARGGKGGNTSSVLITEQHGPGGGGGGGVVWTSAGSRPQSVSFDVRGGANGVFTTYNNDPWGSTSGGNGATLTGLNIPEGNESERQRLITPLGSPRFCIGGSVVLDAGEGHASYLWSPGGATVRSIITSDPGLYTVVVRDAEGCRSFDTITVVVDALPVADAGPDRKICPGSSTRIGPAGIGQGENFIYSWFPTTGLDDPSARNPTATATAMMRYTLTITDTVTGCSADDEMFVRMLETRLVGDRGPIDFGMLDGCRSSRDTTITIVNEGKEALTIVEKSFTGDNAFELLTPALPFIVRPGESATLSIRFAPTSAGRKSARLTLRATPCDAIYSIELTGERGQVALAAEPTAIDFGLSLLCQQATRDTMVLLRNLGTLPLTIESSVLDAPFSLLSPQFPLTIAGGETATLTLHYAPTAAGRFAGELRLPFASGECRDTLRITLAGDVEDQDITADLTSILFPPLLECEPYRDTVITIANRNSVAATLDLAAPGNGFKVLAIMPITLAPHGSVQLPIRFEPTADGQASARLQLTASPCARPLAVDLSGTRIGFAVMLPDTVHFGEILTCLSGGQTTRFVVTGSGAPPGSTRVGSVTVTGPFATDIRPGDILPNGAPVDFGITLLPGPDGEVSGRIDLTFEPCGITRSITVTGRRVSVALAASPSVDLGVLTPGQSDTADVWFTSSGTAAVRIDSLTPIAAPFELIGTEPALPVQLLPGERLRARIRYTAGDGEDRLTIAALGSSPCPVSAETEITGRGSVVPPFAAASVVALPILEAEPGERVRIPVTLRSSTNLLASEARRFSISVSFNKTLLVPDNAATAGVERDGERVISFEGIRGDQVESGEIAFIEMTAALGNAESTPLVIEAFEWIDDHRVTIARIDGEFRLAGLCLEGGTRLFRSDGRLALDRPVPNPVDHSTMLEYEVTEPGRTTLEIRNLLGEVVATPVDGLLIPGRYQLTVDATALSAGRYYCILRTPTRSLTQVMLVR